MSLLENLYEIDLSKEPVKPKLYLAKPDKKIIGVLNSAYGEKLKLRLGNINELTFELPFEIDINNQLKRNPHVDNVLERFLIKLELGNFSEWFIIRNAKNEMDEESDSKFVKCYSLAHELADKKIRRFEANSVNASSAMTQVLSSSLWNLDYVDADFDITYLNFDINSTSALQAVFNIAEAFGGLLIFNNENRTISLYDFDNIGHFRGLMIKRYVQNLEHELEVSETPTRLRVYGKNNISIAGANISGSDFIESFDYYIYPFEQDGQGNVIKSSKYMSDGLCQALVSFQELLESKESDFNSLFSNKEDLLSQLDSRLAEMSVLQDQLSEILKNIDIGQANEDDVSQLLIARNNKQSEINVKQLEINQLENDITVVDDNIEALRAEIALEENLSPEEIQELNYYIIEEEITNDNIDNEKELLEFAKKTFDKIRQPAIFLKTDLVNFLSCIEEAHNHDKLILGDFVGLEVEKFNLNVKAKIVSIDIDFEDDSIDLTVSNVEDIKNNKDKYIAMINKTINTSNSFSMDRFKYNNAAVKTDEVSQLLESKWNASLREIVSGSEDSVEINPRGITSFNSSNQNKALRIMQGIIGITTDGFNSLGVCLDGSGVYAERLIGQIIAGVNLTITNQAGNFLVNQNGVQIQDLDLTITRSDNKSRILMNADSGIKIQARPSTTWIDKFYADNDGNLILDATITATAGTIGGWTIDGTNGLKLGTGSNTRGISTGNIAFYAGNASPTLAPFRVSTSGVATVSSINITGGTILIGANFNVDSNGVLTATGANIYGDINMTGGSISWSNVTAPAYSQITGSKPPTNAEPNPSYITSTKITQTTIESPSITGGTITGGQIIGGSITSNTTIDVGTDLKVGRNLYLETGTYQSKSIVFTPLSEIRYSGINNNLVLYSENTMQLQASQNIQITPFNGYLQLPLDTYVGVVNPSMKVATMGDLSSVVAVFG